MVNNDFNFILADSLLQDTTDIITNCNSYFIIKCNKSLFQNAVGFLLKNVTFITECDNFITEWRSYYKICVGTNYI